MSNQRKVEDLADEAADCIESCGLRGEELRGYLAAWICDCAFSGDLDQMRAERTRLSAKYDKILKRGEKISKRGKVIPIR